MTLKEQCERCGKAVEAADCKTLDVGGQQAMICPQCFADYESGSDIAMLREKAKMACNKTTLEHVDGSSIFFEPELDTKLDVFASGAFRYATGRRYDLMSPLAAPLMDRTSPYGFLMNELLTFHIQDSSITACLSLYCKMQNLIQKTDAEILDLYAQALDESSRRYGDRNWEKGIPESNLVNHAIAHAIKFDAGDTSEEHASHLVWNVMTIIHFRLRSANGAM